jgi:hypothetical protein
VQCTCLYKVGVKALLLDSRNLNLQFILVLFWFFYKILIGCHWSASISLSILPFGPQVYHYKFGWLHQNLQALITFPVCTYCSFCASFAELSCLIARSTWFHVQHLCIVSCFNQRAMDFAICALFYVSTKGLWILPVIDELYKTWQGAVLRIAIAVSLQATIDLLSYLQICLLLKNTWQMKWEHHVTSQHAHLRDSQKAIARISPLTLHQSFIRDMDAQ